MFVDASAIVAILLKETGATDLTNQIDAASDPVTSTLAVFEAVTAISREAGLPGPDHQRFAFHGVNPLANRLLCLAAAVRRSIAKA